MLKKSVVLTNQAQPSPTLVIRDDVVVKVLDRNQGQKRLGCMLTAAGSMRQDVDLLYHIQQGTKVSTPTVGYCKIGKLRCLRG